VVGERRRKPRLADTGVAEDQMHTSARSAGVLEGVRQLCELARASNQRPLARR